MDVSLSIPHRLHNAIIGPKGKLVQSVMTECGGVRIQFPPAGDSKRDEVKLHGPKDDVEKAKKMLLELKEEQVGEREVWGEVEKEMEMERERGGGGRRGGTRERGREMEREREREGEREREREREGGGGSGGERAL